MKGFCMGFGSPGTFNRSQDIASPGKSGGGKGRRNRFFGTGLTGRQRSAGLASGVDLVGFLLLPIQALCRKVGWKS